MGAGVAPSDGTKADFFFGSLLTPLLTSQEGRNSSAPPCSVEFCSQSTCEGREPPVHLGLERADHAPLLPGASKGDLQKLSRTRRSGIRRGCLGLAIAIQEVLN